MTTPEDDLITPGKPIYLNVGDHIEIVNYGHVLHWFKSHYKELYEAGFVTTEIPINLLNEGETWYTADLCPELVGQKAMITEKHMIHSGIPKYALQLENGKKIAWFDQQQLKLIQ